MKKHATHSTFTHMTPPLKN